MVFLCEDKDNFLPWKKVKNWECQKCSVCCYHYSVPLAEDEVEYFKKINPDNVHEGKDQWYMYHKKGVPCKFLKKTEEGEFCGIQNHKPISCRLYPFYISKVDEKTPKDAIFELDGEKFSVYIPTFCKGLKKGNNMEEVIPEAIYIWQRKEIPQKYTTSSK